MYFCDTNTKSKTKPFKHIPSCRQTKTLLSDTKPSTTVFATITAAGHSTTWLMRAATRSTTRIGNECHPEENPKETRRKRLAVKPFGCTDGETGFLHDCPMWKKGRKPAFLFHANQQLTFCKFIVKTSYIIVLQCFTKYITCR